MLYHTKKGSDVMAVKRKSKAAPILGAVGMFSLMGGAASAGANTPASYDTAPVSQIVLSDDAIVMDNPVHIARVRYFNKT
jgi:hypothetical protein